MAHINAEPNKLCPGGKFMSSRQCTLKATAGDKDFSWEILSRGCLHAEVGSKQKFFTKQVLFLRMSGSAIFSSPAFSSLLIFFCWILRPS